MRPKAKKRRPNGTITAAGEIGIIIVMVLFNLLSQFSISVSVSISISMGYGCFVVDGDGGGGDDDHVCLFGTTSLKAI